MYDRFEQPLENRAIIDCKFDEARRVSNYETFYQFASFSFSLIFLSCIFFLFIHVISGREIVAPRRGGRAKRICEHLHNNRLVRSVAGAKQSIRNDGKGHSAIAFTIPRSPRVNLETVRDGKSLFFSSLSFDLFAISVFLHFFQASFRSLASVERFAFPRGTEDQAVREIRAV